MNDSIRIPRTAEEVNRVQQDIIIESRPYYEFIATMDMRENSTYLIGPNGSLERITPDRTEAEQGCRDNIAKMLECIKESHMKRLR